MGKKLSTFLIVAVSLLVLGSAGFAVYKLGLIQRIDYLGIESLVYEKIESYVNPELGFSFSYPTSKKVPQPLDTSLQVYEAEKLYNNASQRVDVAYGYSDIFVLSLSIYESNLSAYEWWKTEGIEIWNDGRLDPTGPEEEPNVPFDDFAVVDISLDNVKGIRLVRDTNSKTPTVFTVVAQDGYIYAFDQFHPLIDGSSLKIYDYILTTFRFAQ